MDKIYSHISSILSEKKSNQKPVHEDKKKSKTTN